MRVLLIHIKIVSTRGGRMKSSKDGSRTCLQSDEFYFLSENTEERNVQAHSGTHGWFRNLRQCNSGCSETREGSEGEVDRLLRHGRIPGVSLCGLCSRQRSFAKRVP